MCFVASPQARSGREALACRVSWECSRGPPGLRPPTVLFAVPSVLRGTRWWRRPHCLMLQGGQLQVQPHCCVPLHPTFPSCLCCFTACPPRRVWKAVPLPPPLPRELLGSLWLSVLFPLSASLLHMPPCAVRSKVIFPTHCSHFQYNPCPTFFLPFLPHTPSVLSHETQLSFFYSPSTLPPSERFFFLKKPDTFLFSWNKQ